MTWTPSKQQLEDAAIAGGIKGQIEESDYDFWFTTDNDWTWQPYLPSDQGKADLLDLMLVAGIQWDEENGCIDAWRGWITSAPVVITNNDKHAALARAVIEVAAQGGAKMRGEV